MQLWKEIDVVSFEFSFGRAEYMVGLPHSLLIICCIIRVTDPSNDSQKRRS